MKNHFQTAHEMDGTYGGYLKEHKL